MKTRTLDASFTRPDNSTQYAAGDVVGTDPAAVLAFQCGDLHASGRVLGAVVIDSANEATDPDLELWLFDTAPAAVADNAAFAPSDAELARLVGVLALGSAFDASSGLAFQAGAPGIGLGFTLPAGASQLHGVLVARNAYTPVAEEAFTVRLVVALD
jgi:hypothetical protein